VVGAWPSLPETLGKYVDHIENLKLFLAKCPIEPNPIQAISQRVMRILTLILT